MIEPDITDTSFNEPNTIDIGTVTLTAPKRGRKPKETIEPETDEEVEAEEPEQATRHKWEFLGRQNPKWGTVTKQGLVIGCGDRKRVIPPDEVWKLANMGCSVQEIADWFQVSRETLKYNFHDYILKAREELKQRLRLAQIKTAVGGNPTMLIWLGKQYLGQSDTPNNSEDKQPLPWTDE